MKNKQSGATVRHCQTSSLQYRKQHKILEPALVLLAFLLAIAVVQFSISSYSVNSAYSIAQLAARQAASQFQQIMEGSFRELTIAADGMQAAAANQSDSDLRSTLLGDLVAGGSLENAALIEQNTLTYANGSTAQAEDAKVYIVYRRDGVSGKIITEDGGAIELRVPVDVQRELVGWLDMAALDQQLLGVLDGSYSYALYNSATGRYLINRSDFDQKRYYDTLLDIDEDGSAASLMTSSEAQARVRIDGEAIYIAQCPSGIQPWCMALMLPEALVSAENSHILLWLHVASAALQLGLLAYAAVYLVRGCIREKKSCLQQRRMGVAMLNRIASDASLVICAYSRSEDRITDFHEGFRLSCCANQEPPKSIEALASQYGIDEDDVEQLRESLRECRSGLHSELNLNASAQDGEHLLRIELQCLEDRQDCVLLSLRDCTLDMEREDVLRAEESFRRRMQGKAVSIWQIDVARNRWRLTGGSVPDALRKLGVSGDWREYMSDVTGALREYIEAGDYECYAEQLSVEGLSRLMRTGGHQMTLECRAHSLKSGVYEWHRLLVRVYRHPEQGEMIADLYVMNVDAEKNAELERQERARVLQQTLTAISGIYNGLYYAELDMDRCYTAKAVGGSISSQLSQSYRGMVDTFVAGDVHPEDREAIRQLLDPYHLRRRMTENSHLVRHEYRRRVGENYETAAIIVQAARFENGTVRDIAIAMRRYTEKAEKGNMSI